MSGAVSPPGLELVWPAREYLPGYVAALERGWSPENQRPEAAREELARCLGHIGYAVVPWKRGRGYATRALALLLPQAAREGLPYVELTTDEPNVVSRRVITANGGELVERFTKPPEHGGGVGLRFRIQL